MLPCRMLLFTFTSNSKLSLGQFYRKLTGHGALVTFPLSTDSSWLNQRFYDWMLRIGRWYRGLGDTQPLKLNIVWLSNMIQHYIYELLFSYLLSLFTIFSKYSLIKMLSYERCIVLYLEDKQTCAWDSDQQQKYKFNLIGEQVSYKTL